MHDLRRLRAFHAVAGTGSFSEAALELGYGQSVVSHHVAALEREFGLTLVNRGTRPVSLTDAGERLAGHAEAVLGRMTAAEDELRALVGLEAGALRVGAFLSASYSFVPAALAAFHADYPAIDVRLEQIELPDAVRRVRSGEVDIAVVWRVADGEGERLDDGVVEHHLADDPYRVVLPATHPLARQREVSLADLAGERFTAPPAEGFSLPYRAMLERLCAEAGFEPDITHVVRDVSVAMAFVAAGLSVGLTSHLSVADPHPDIAVRPLRDGGSCRSLYAIWLRARRVPAIAHMARYLGEAAAVKLG